MKCNLSAQRSTFRKCLLPALTGILVSGCIYVPKTVHRYDEACQILIREAELDRSSVGQISRCEDEGCIGAVLQAGFVSAGSAIISGSIVLVSNVAYWIEKEANCNEYDAVQSDASGVLATEITETVIRP